MLYDLLEGTRVFYFSASVPGGGSVHFVSCMHAGGGREQVICEAREYVNAIATWGRRKAGARMKMFQRTKRRKKKKETMEPRKLALGYEKLFS